MAHCSYCKALVHHTVKECPSCGGDFTKLFGPTAAWGDPPVEENLETATQKIRHEALNRKAGINQPKPNKSEEHPISKNPLGFYGPIIIFILLIVFTFLSD